MEDPAASPKSGSPSAVFNRALATTTGRVILAVVGVVVILVLLLVVRSCGDGGDPPSDALLLVRESGGDLYVGSARTAIDREDRVVRDFDGLIRAVVTRDDTWRYAGTVDVGDRQILAARTQDGDGAWVIDGSDVDQIVSKSGDVGVVVLGDTLYYRESSEGTAGCYRGSVGSLDDFDRVFRGDSCVLTYSGYVMGADLSGDTWRVSVWTPEGDKTGLYRANFQIVPRLSENGNFLVSTDSEGVTVTAVETGDRVWELDGGVSSNVASHPDGHIAIAAEASSGEVYLVAVDHEGNADELLEVSDGQLVAEFAPSGDLFWLESGQDDQGVLSVWDVSEKDVIELADEEGLQLVGVSSDSAVTVIEDDLGALFQRFSPTDSRGIELHEFDDDVRANLIYEDFLYIAGSEIASVVPLGGNEPTDSLTWDAIEILDVQNGLLVAVGSDGSSDVLFSIRVGSEDDVEYGEYEDVISAQVYGNTLYASVRDGLGVDTLAFEVSSGDRRDEDADYDGYRLVSNREWPIRSTLFAAGYAREVIAAPEPTAEPASDTTLSEQHYEALYGARGIESGVLHPGNIVSLGDFDRYLFEIPSGGRWLYAETYGQTDVEAELYSAVPDGTTVSIAYSDDDGGDSNARFDLFLDPGWYFIEVRGYDNNVTGRYEVNVTF